MVEEEFDMEITILEVFEENDQLRVKVQTPYGIDNIGMSPDKKFLDPVTQQPRFLKEVKKLLEKKYKPQKAKKEELYQDLKGKSIMFSELEQSFKVPGFAKRLISIGFTREEAEKIIKKYENHSELRKDIRSKINLGFSKETNERLEDYYGGETLEFTKSKFKK